jgi:N-acyl-D-aspartate/D-glutamate deacylase
MLDIKITGGTIVDGSGRPGFRGDVGIKDGRIVAVGEVAEEARDTVDATGRIVSPGFIDAHSHYDAQVFWDPKLSPSCYHGVTTVFGGFCGFSIAPITPEAAGYIMPMLARVEGMPLETLAAAVPWNWQSFGEYLGLLDGKIGINAGFFAGHSPIRRIVMGERAVGETATPEDIEQMKTLLGQSLEQGAMGFSTSIAPTHNDGDGQPVPSRWASHEEIVQLARVVRDYPGTGLEMLPGIDFAPGVPELITEFSLAANRPVNWNVLVVSGRDDSLDVAKRKLEITDYARSRGAEVIALTVPSPTDIFINMRTGFVLDALPGLWCEMFQWPGEERLAKFKDAEFRKKLLADADSLPVTSELRGLIRFEDYTIVSAVAEKNRKYDGRRVADIASEEGRDPFDVLMDIVVESGLDAVLMPIVSRDAKKIYELRSQLWQDDRTLIGGSDAGAHLDMIDTFACTSVMLAKGVREHGVIALEKAIHLITQRPATYYGLIDRGTLKPGYFADIVIFDPATIGKGPTYNRFDVPGGDVSRVYADAEGIGDVFVNGVQIVRDGEHTGKLPGTVLRSGKDTETVTINAMRANKSQMEPAL